MFCVPIQFSTILVHFRAWLESRSAQVQCLGLVRQQKSSNKSRMCLKRLHFNSKMQMQSWAAAVISSKWTPLWQFQACVWSQVNNTHLWLVNCVPPLFLGKSQGCNLVSVSKFFTVWISSHNLETGDCWCVWEFGSNYSWAHSWLRTIFIEL